MTLPEVILWQNLRGVQQGIRFRRQHPIGPYIVDFYAPALRLAVEIDGEAHNCGDHPAHDAERDRFLADNRHALLRLPATLILTDLDAALTAIRAAIPPRNGEGDHTKHGGGGSPQPLRSAAAPLRHGYAAPPPRPGED